MKERSHHKSSNWGERTLATVPVVIMFAISYPLKDSEKERFSPARSKEPNAGVEPKQEQVLEFLTHMRSMRSVAGRSHLKNRFRIDRGVNKSCGKICIMKWEQAS
jgi:hypothetical protein